MDKCKEFIIKNNLGVVIENGTFANITTFKVGGKIKLLYYPNSYENFIVFYKYYLEFKRNIELLIIGNGSNILASDDEYNGIVVSFKYIDEKIEIMKKDKLYYVTCYAGTTLNNLSKFLMNNSISGGEFFHHIPGVVGGSICMNASSYGKDMASIVSRVYCLLPDGEALWINKEDLKFGYRESLIKKNKLIVIKVEFVFNEIKDIELIKEKINEYKKRKIETQPINYPSAGSVFKNRDNKSSWRIIDELGFRGKCYGGCCVSEKHSNFIINKNNARALDIYKLMNLVKEKYHDVYNDELECEWILINFKD